MSEIFAMRLSTVRLTVVDQNPLSEDTIETRSVLLLDEVLKPDVVGGLSPAAAEAAIVGANLAVGKVTTANSNVVPAGDVISQNPVGGTPVLPGSPVDLVVSLGPDVGPPAGDIDGDGDVDSDDIALIMAARNTPAAGPDDPRDLDGDGLITVDDARQAVLMCTNPRCS